jgi:hypothetical protein
MASSRELGSCHWHDFEWVCVAVSVVVPGERAAQTWAIALITTVVRKMPMMNDEPMEEIKRGEHRVPRWITVLWLAFVLGLALASIVMAVRLNCDPVRTLGFLAASSNPSSHCLLLRILRCTG